MHISRTERPAGVPPYKPASAVILAELGKLLCSLLLAYRECKKALKKERNPSSTFLFDADTEQSTNVLSRSSSLNSLHRQSQSQSRKGSLATYSQLDAIAEIEEKKEGLLPSADIKLTALPMSRRTSSQSSSISVNTSSSTSSTPQGKYSSLPKHRRESSLTEEDDELLPEYPGSPSERIRNNFANEEITPMEVIKRMKQDTFGPDWLKLSIPAFLFTGQSNLSYYASSNLSVPVFQITYQLKVSCSVVLPSLLLKH